MTVVEIKDIERKDVPIYYRRVYEGMAAVEAAGKTSNIRIAWTIETSPLGINETAVKMIDSIDYPLIPLLKELKKKIEYLDSEGRLPL